MFVDLKPKVIAVVAKVFETMFFIYVEPCEGSENSSEETPKGDVRPQKKTRVPWIKSEMGFRGQTSGKIRLWLPRPLAETMAGNFLGSEENGHTDSQVRDVAAEMTNVITGNLFLALDKKSNYVFSVPKTRFLRGPGVRGNGPAPLSAMEFDAEGQRFWLQVRMDT